MSDEPIDCDEAPLLRYFREQAIKPIPNKHLHWAMTLKRPVSHATCCGRHLLVIGTVAGGADGYICPKCSTVYTLAIDPPAV